MSRSAVGRGSAHADHFQNRDVLGQADHQRQAGVGRFVHRLEGKFGGHKDDRGIGPGRFAAARTVSKIGNLPRSPSNDCPPLPGTDAADDIGAEGDHLLVWNVPRGGDTLYQ